MSKLVLVDESKCSNIEKKILYSGGMTRCGKCGKKMVLYKVYEGGYFIDTGEPAYRYSHRCPSAFGMMDNIFNFGHQSLNYRADGYCGFGGWD